MESSGGTPARFGPAVSLDLTSHSDELLSGTEAYGPKREGKEKKTPSSSFLCAWRSTEGPYSLSAPRKAVPASSSSSPLLFARVYLSCLARDGAGYVYHSLTYEYRRPGR